MKTVTPKKASPASKTRRASSRATALRNVRMPDFMGNLRKAFGDQNMDHLFESLLPELHPDMRSVNLTQAAYERREAWRTHASETMSEVILRVVPSRGSFRALTKAANGLTRLTPKGERALLKALG